MVKINLSVDDWLHEKKQRNEGNRKDSRSVENSKCVANNRSVETSLYLEDYRGRSADTSLKGNLKACIYWAHHWSLKASFCWKKATIRLPEMPKNLSMI